MRTTPLSHGFGQLSPADLTLPPTQPIDITALVANELATASRPTAG